MAGRSGTGIDPTRWWNETFGKRCASLTSVPGAGIDAGGGIATTSHTVPLVRPCRGGAALRERTNRSAPQTDRVSQVKLKAPACPVNSFLPVFPDVGIGLNPDQFETRSLSSN